MPDIPNGGGVRITNRELYDILMSLRDRVAGVERRVDAVLGENKELNGRIRKLELRYYGVAAGLVAAVALLAGATFR